MTSITSLTKTVNSISNVSILTSTCETAHRVGAPGYSTTSSIVCRALVDVWVKWQT